MAFKTIEQLNQEFLNELASNKKAFVADVPEEAAEADVLEVAIAEVLEDAIADVYDVPIETIQFNEVPVPVNTETSVEKRKNVKRKTPLWKDMLFLIIKIALIMLVFVAMFTFLFGIVRYGEPSMAPSIKDGDLVIYHRYTKVGYMTRDAIVLEHNGQIQARRVVAVAGDWVDITEDGLVINGSVQQETDIYQVTERYVEGLSFPLTVPEGHVFVLGDSREGATDSRVYGTVDIEDTLGKVMAIMRRRSI